MRSRIVTSDRDDGERLVLDVVAVEDLVEGVLVQREAVVVVVDLDHLDRRAKHLAANLGPCFHNLLGRNRSLFGYFKALNYCMQYFASFSNILFSFFEVSRSTITESAWPK